MVSHSNWMIYGANGFTGQLLVAEAVRRGHRPILAGRSASKLAPVAEKHGLKWLRSQLNDPKQLASALRDIDLVFHAAGPFQFTSQPMLQACLESGVNYIDITGEIPVFQNTFSQHEKALQAGVVLISGAGFDVIPSDCLAKYVAEKLPTATELQIGVASSTRPSSGTVKSSIEMMPRGGMRRENGKLVPQPFGEGARQIRFSHRHLETLPISWGDLETAYRSTGIPNITTYMAYPPHLVKTVRRYGPLVQKLVRVRLLRRIVQMIVARSFKGPNAEMRQHSRSYVWAMARDAEGNQTQAWLETMEAYQLTAVAGLRCVERLLAERPVGALTPAQAFGADFILEIEGSKRFDALQP
jgi:short subunit dehydrogenase-like uncharacterized protein